MNISERFQALVASIDQAFLDRDSRKYGDAIGELCDLVLPVLEPPVNEDWARLKLTPIQSKIVDILHLKLGKLVTKTAIYQSVYPSNYPTEPDPKIIDIYISAIRAKIEGEYHIETVYGVGYKLIQGPGPRTTYFKQRKLQGKRQLAKPAEVRRQQLRIVA